MQKAVFNTKFADWKKYNGQVVEILDKRTYISGFTETRYDIKFNDGTIEKNVYSEELIFSEEAIEIAEIKLAIKNISKQLSHIRRRDRVSCSFGSKEETYELKIKREEYRKKLRQLKRKYNQI